MSRLPPSPERIESWEQQTLALLEARRPPEKVVAHLKYVGCPAPLAQEIVQRNRKTATRGLRRKGLGMLLYGAALLAGCLLAVIVVGITGLKVPMLSRYLLLGAILGVGMIVYGGLQLIFG